ncbi:MAG: CDP-alcohol phosphatidyltransferase family protein [Deltaproteobacteria bacterium]|nr:CDP-alcohol phosphatidyltransferase family protein [Deltaproteobacteria bacterium]
MSGTSSNMTLANVFTAARFVLIPLFGFLWLRGQGVQALVVFLIAVLTDILDGFIARYFHQFSRLGAILDPAADKVLLLVGYVVGALVHAIPVWLAVFVIGRDVVVAIGAGLFAWVWRGRHDPEDWRPSRIGKYTMFIQSFAVALALFVDVVRPAGGRAWLQVILMMTAMMTLCSGIQYVLIGLRALGRGAAAKGAS